MMEWIKTTERMPKPNYRIQVKEFGGRNNTATYRKGNPQSERYWTETVEFWLDESLQSKGNTKNGKTASEILEEFGCPAIPFDENVTMYYPAIISAMEEYAQPHANQNGGKTESIPERIYRDVVVCQKVEEILKPEYMNSVFTWLQIKDAILALPPKPRP